MRWIIFQYPWTTSYTAIVVAALLAVTLWLR